MSNEYGLQITNPVDSFGSVRVVEPSPFVQIDPVAGLRTKTDVETFTDGVTGAVSVENTGGGNEFKCETGTGVGGYGLIRSKRFVRSRSGQSQRLVWSARYPDVGVTNSTIRSGGVTSGTELSFGYNGTSFGILYRTGGILEVQTLTLTVAATGAENGTVTLDGTDVVVSLTAGTIAHNAAEIAAATFSGWEASQNGSTVIFMALATGDKTGAFTYASDGTSAGSLAETAAGVAPTDTWIAQADWNVDKMDGNGPTGVSLDVTKGNVYQVSYHQDYGDITFSIESQARGHFHDVHEIEHSNNSTSPALLQPSLKIGWFAASLGSTTPLTIYGSSAAGFIDGNINNLQRNPESHANTKTGVGTTLTNILTIRSSGLFNSFINTEEVLGMLATIAVEGTKPAQAEIILNGVIAGEQNWSYHDESDSVVEVDTSGTTVTLDASSQAITIIALSKTGSAAINLKDLNIRLRRTDTLTIAVKATSGTTDPTVGVTWIED
jgi:hypothetical protein